MKHKNVLSRLTALGIIMVLVMGLFTACGSTEKEPVKKGKRRTADTSRKNAYSLVTPMPTVTVEPDGINPGPPEGKVITMWCIAVELDSTRHAYEAAIEEFQKRHPGITIDWKAYQNDEYKMLTRMSAENDTLPDMFFDWGGYMIDNLAKAGKLYCLDSEYEKHADMLSGQMLTNGTVDGHLYGVPYLMYNSAMFINMDILQAAGYTKVPETYEEFLVCCQKIKEAGKIPIGCALEEAWCVSEVLDSMIVKTIGAKAFDDIFRGRASWNNPGVAAAVDAFIDMRDKGYIGMAKSQRYNDEIKLGFMSGDYAFYINGTWNCADFSRGAGQFGINYDIAEFPVMSSQAALGQLYGGPQDHLCVSSSAENPEEIAGYAFELAQILSKYCYLDGCGIPTWTVDYSDGHVNPLTRRAAQLTANASAIIGFGDVVMTSADTLIYYDMLGRLISGKCDGAEFVRSITEQTEKNRR